MHVLVSVKRGAKVKVFDVDTHILRIGRAEDAVSQDFGRGEVCGACGEFAGVGDEVATGGDADSVGVGFLGAVVNHNPDVCDSSVLGSIENVAGVHDEERVCSFGAGFVVALH